jgi:hypothetical protein
MCVNGGLEGHPRLKSSVWHLVLKLRRLALKRRRQLVSAGGHGSLRPRWRAAPAGNDVSQHGETNRSGLGGWGPREGRRGGAPGGCEKRWRLRGWRAVECKMTGALCVAFGWRSGAPDLSFHSLHRWGGFHLIRSLIQMNHYTPFYSVFYEKQNGSMFEYFFWNKRTRNVPISLIKKEIYIPGSG